ncbi:MAG TPA: flippase, partial [Thermotoga sp.]|nr:flippase [Thermotoga sp.]
AIAKITERFWAFFVGGLVIYLFRSFSGFILALLMGYSLRDILRIKWGKNFIQKPGMRFNLKRWKSLLRHSYPFWFIGIFTMIYYRIDMVMLGLLKGDYETGIYRAAYTLIEVSLFIPNIVVSTTIPSMARLWRKDRKTLNILFKRSFQILVIIGIVGALGYYIFADLGIFFVFGREFKSSVPVLRILAFAIPFMFLNSLFGSYMNATGRELTFTKITGFTALLNVILNCFLILHYGAEGAAVATVVSQVGAIILSALYLFNRKEVVYGSQ